ncbi:hypothetical protein TRIUR3_30784 [Triticum urartu]|uniref:Uncharacterized protein n=1 Tax=Triticum urartu TaxID=4572 RepID=M8A4Z2_TRIUA|nr:hypothetical protein TRIUR3_30784 [Triticum urartu]
MALSNDVVTRAVFGGKFSQQGEYLCELDKAFKLLGGFYLVDLFPSSRLVRWLSNGERQMKKSCGRGGEERLLGTSHAVMWVERGGMVHTLGPGSSSKRRKRRRRMRGLSAPL